MDGFLRCDNCKGAFRNLHVVNTVYISVLSNLCFRKKEFCKDCIFEVQFFVDKKGFVRMNMITAVGESSCSILDDMKDR